MTAEHERAAALLALMQLPDSADLPKRGRRYLYPGDAKRRDVIKRDLERAYLRWRMQDAGKDESSIVCVRRGMGVYRLVKRA